MSTTTAAALDVPKRHFGRTLLSLCSNGGQFILKHPLAGLWWAIRYMPFSGHFLLVYSAMMWWFGIDTNQVLWIGNFHLTLESAIIMGAAITASAEIIRMSLMRERIKLLLIGPLMMGFVYVILALTASNNFLSLFHSNVFHLVVGLTLFSLLAVMLAGFAILQRSSDIHDDR